MRASREVNGRHLTSSWKLMSLLMEWLGGYIKGVIGGACHSTSYRQDRQPTGREGPLRGIKAWVRALALLNMHNWNNSKAIQRKDFNLGTQT